MARGIACKMCRKVLVVLEKGSKFLPGTVAYCGEHDPALASAKKQEANDFFSMLQKIRDGKA